MEQIIQDAVAQSGFKETIVNNKQYKVLLLPATRGLTIGQKLVKLVLPLFGILEDNNDEDKFLGEDKTLFTDLSIMVVRSMDDIDMVNTIKELLTGCYCNGQLVEFDTHFAANYGELIAVVEFALKENFGDFFTSYLKAKGLPIPTLREMKEMQQAPSTDASND